MNLFDQINHQQGLLSMNSLSRWKDAIDMHLANLSHGACRPGVHFNKVGKLPFQGSLEFGSIGKIEVARITCSPSYYKRDKQAVLTHGPLILVNQIIGTSCLQSSKESLDTLLVPGDWAFYDTQKPFQITTSDEISQQICFLLYEGNQLPLQEFKQKLQGKRFGRRGLGRVIHNSLLIGLSEYKHMNERGRASLSESISRMLINFISDETMAPTLIRSKRDNLISFIEENLHNDDLTIKLIASSLGCSERHLHRLFNNVPTNNTTCHEGINKYIWRRRLEHCYEELKGTGTLSITEIAFNWGFTSSQHFSRKFRSAYGVTPSQIQQADQPH